MSVCDQPSYTCTSFDTKKQVNHIVTDKEAKHTEDRVFTLTSGAVSIDINTRTRNYSYKSRETWDFANGRVVIDGDAEFDCGVLTTTESASINEDYKTVDCTFFYADLRNDCFVYEEKTAHLTWNQTSPERIPLNDGWGNSYVYPFIEEAAPILRTTRIVCTSLPLQEIHKDVVNAGYGIGIRVLMPTWDGKSPPRHTIFTMGGVTYDAFEVDWYSQFDNWEADGDLFLWWPDWLRSTGTNNEIDADAAKELYEAYHGDTTPAIHGISNGVKATPFMGSCAFDGQRNQFMSANFFNGEFLFNRLEVGGAETPIPQEKFQVEQPDGTFKEEDSQHDIYYPVAPL